jgi:kynurenine formamidase
MASRDIALTMCDTSAGDAQPSGEQGPDYSVPCHAEMQTRRSIWNLENVDTKSLVDRKIFEGAFIWAPLRIIGATGSPGNPVVVYRAGARAAATETVRRRRGLDATAGLSNQN